MIHKLFHNNIFVVKTVGGSLETYNVSHSSLVASMNATAQTDLIGSYAKILEGRNSDQSERSSRKESCGKLAEEETQKANQALNERMREYRKEEIDIDYRRKCEDKIYELKDKFNGLSIEIRKIIQEAKELRESEARARSQKIIIDDDDDNLGFYAVHPNTIHTPVSQNVEPKDSLIMGDGHINTTPETETISVETLVSIPM
ncbi:hypothetical protein Tco_0198995 [Tanacetum coccineum]